MDDYPAAPSGGGGRSSAAPVRYYGSLETDTTGIGGKRAAAAAGAAQAQEQAQAQAQAQARAQRRRGGRSPVKDRSEVVKGALFGAINASICLPASVSFATIIFRHEAFGASSACGSGPVGKHKLV